MSTNKKNVAEIVAGLSERKIAKTLGISRHAAKKVKNGEASLAARDLTELRNAALLLAEAETQSHAPGASFQAADENQTLIESLRIPERAVRSHTVSRWDVKAGRAEKITYNPSLVAIEDSRATAEELFEVIDGFEYTPPRKADTSDAALVCNFSDLQIGKAGQRGGGTKGTIERVMRSLEKIIQDVRENPVRTIVVVDGGDVIENFNNVSTQESTNDMPLTEQIRTARRLFMEILKRLAPEAPEVIYVAVPSNHGQVRKAIGTPMNTTDDDFGLEIFEQIKDAFELAGNFPNVSFVRTEPLEETAVLDVAGTRLAFHHGHHTKGGIHGHDKFWQGQDHGRRPGWDADIFVTAHYHTFTIQQSGNARWIISVASSDPGSDWFTNGTGASSSQGVTTFRVLDGQWFDPKPAV